jgi:CheY-like chemotaxis protein
VQVTGTGRPILLIPGLASSGDTWTTTVAHLSGRFICHVLTLAGFAGTPPIDGPLFPTVRRDLAFLDIQMPGGSGFDVLERLERVPLVVFTTAFDEYAVRAFEVNAFDYLMKPVRPERLASVLEKARSTLIAGRDSRPDRPRSSTERVFLLDGERSCSGPRSCCSRWKGTTLAPISAAKPAAHSRVTQRTRSQAGSRALLSGEPPAHREPAVHRVRREFGGRHLRHSHEEHARGAGVATPVATTAREPGLVTHWRRDSVNFQFPTSKSQETRKLLGVGSWRLGVDV